nr:flavodoxin-dependent (E)-4-hydroxy-3-methylbut-2-enyl-diphosphate synthase [Caulobacter sp. B11]
MGLRHRGVNIIACPSCAGRLQCHQDGRGAGRALAHISQPMSLSIIGCVVNGPGEALMTDLASPRGAGSGMIYMAARRTTNSPTSMIEHIVELVEQRRGAEGRGRRRSDRGGIDAADPRVTASEAALIFRSAA